MSFDFDEYQKFTKSTSRYPKITHPVVYPALGLAGEAGEVVDKIKKVFRDKDGNFDTETVENIKKELGDVLWYVSQIAFELGISLSDVIKSNVSKLKDRIDRNVISGEGDDR